VNGAANSTVPGLTKLTAAARYQALEQDRQPFLDRARECAALTIPAVMPPKGFTQHSVLPTPYQSLGARGARVLASKLLLALFPSIPFFNYKIDDKPLKELGERRGEIEKALASRERAVVTELDTSVFRPTAFTALLHLVITGNALVYIPPKQEDRARMWRLDQYVTRRDAAGNLLEFIVKETLDYLSLPPEVQAIVVASEEQQKQAVQNGEAKPIDIYTRGHLQADGKWRVYQEVAGEVVPGTEGSFKKGELPYLALGLSWQPGEHYARGYCEEYLGDLDSLEALSEALVEGSAASARILFLVDPAGVTSIQVVANARTGDVRSGKADDVTTMQVQKGADLNVAKAQAEEIANRLSYAFLLHQSVQRNGERVTAEEIRYMASELDDGLGGIYTLFAADFQLPAVRLFERRMELRLGEKALPKDMVQPVIVAGLEAIGRGHNQMNLKAFISDIIAVLTPEVAMKYLKPGELIARSAAAYSIDTEGLIPSDDEIEQQEQMAMVMQLIQHLGPQGITAAGGMGKEAVKGAMTPPAAPPQ
jgi:hypothetical protein